MANEIDVTVNATTDADDVIERVADSAVSSGTRIERAMGDSEQAFDSAARASGRLGEAFDMASGAGSQLSGGIGDIGGAMTAFSDLSNLARNKALEQEQALLDVESAQNDYNEAVAEFGPDSLEARQAQAALNQALAAAEPPTAMAEWGEKLEMLSPIIMAAVGAADLLMLANTALNASFVKNAAVQAGSKIATLASAAATGIATAAQWLWNAAFAASGIGLIILAVAALVAGIIYLATQTQFFQKLWEVVWNAVKVAFKAVMDFVIMYYTTAFNLLKTALTSVKNFFIGAFKGAIDFVVNYAQFIYSIPGKIANVFSSLAYAISAPFRAAFNAIARFWNNTVGRLSFSLPSWIPGIGGLGFDMPNLPTFATGAGEVMRTGAALIHRGERIVPASATGFNNGSGANGTVRILFDFSNADAEFARWFRKATRLEGGKSSNSVQIAWGTTA